MIIVNIKGGLGNQLFLYAIGNSIAKRSNIELKVDLSFFENPQFSNVFRLNRYPLDYTIANEEEINRLKSRKLNTILGRIVKLSKINCIYNKKTHLIESQTKNVIKILSSKVKQDFYLDGYFQYPDIFDEFRLDYKAIFVPKQQISCRKLKLLNDIQDREFEIVGLHVRRGDMQANPFFYSLTDKYFNDAISIINEKVKNPFYLIFTDADENILNFNFPKNHYFVNNCLLNDSEYSNTSDVEDLYLLTRCSHFILSNSTFGWWGAYLADNSEKIVIVPKKWYENLSLQRRFESSNLLRPGWFGL